MRVIEMLKSRNRTFLEIDAGILFWVLTAGLVGIGLPLDEWGLATGDYLAGIGLAALLVAVAFRHMKRCLDRAFEWDEKTASRKIFQGYLFRYAALALLLAIVAVTGILNPVVLCLGYLLIMKMAVYSQPTFHRIFNRVFHETDPVPEPLEEPGGENRMSEPIEEPTGKDSVPETLEESGRKEVAPELLEEPDGISGETQSEAVTATSGK